jgi:pyridoxine 5-phosphate synthase
MSESVRSLSVNIDHVATLREARQEAFPDPVQAAVLAELGGADGITVHLRRDRRHIKERDARLLKATIRTELNMELSAVPEMMKIARDITPAQVTLVPETAEEVTTQGGLDLAGGFARIAPHARNLKRAGIRLSAFIEPDGEQIEAAAKLGCDVIELNTEQYSRCFKTVLRHLVPRPSSTGHSLTKDQGRDDQGPTFEVELARIRAAGERAAELGLQVHAGHGIDYRNIVPLLEIPQLTGFSIGFSIIARALLTGLQEATHEMKRIIEEVGA